VLDVAPCVLEFAPALLEVLLDAGDPAAPELPQAASAMPIGIHRHADGRGSADEPRPHKGPLGARRRVRSI